MFSVQRDKIKDKYVKKKQMNPINRKKYINIYDKPYIRKIPKLIKEEN